MKKSSCCLSNPYWFCSGYTSRCWCKCFRISNNNCRTCRYRNFYLSILSLVLNLINLSFIKKLFLNKSTSVWTTTTWFPTAKRRTPVCCKTWIYVSLPVVEPRLVFTPIMHCLSVDWFNCLLLIMYHRFIYLIKTKWRFD